MLIAIMGDTFDRVTEVRKQSALKEKLKILNDYVYAVSFKADRRGKDFVFSVRPIDFEENVTEDWEGKIGTIKESIEENAKESSEEIKNVIAET